MVRPRLSAGRAASIRSTPSSCSSSPPASTSIASRSRARTASSTARVEGSTNFGQAHPGRSIHRIAEGDDGHCCRRGLVGVCGTRFDSAREPESPASASNVAGLGRALGPRVRWRRRITDSEDIAEVAGQLADLTHGVEEMKNQLEKMRLQAETQQSRADTQQERIDLAARKLAEVSDRLQAAARALRQSYGVRKFGRTAKNI